MATFISRREIVIEEEELIEIIRMKYKNLQDIQRLTFTVKDNKHVVGVILDDEVIENIHGEVNP